MFHRFTRSILAAVMITTLTTTAAHAAVLEDPAQGTPEIKSINVISFAPEGFKGGPTHCQRPAGSAAPAHHTAPWQGAAAMVLLHGWMPGHPGAARGAAGASYRS